MKATYIDYKDTNSFSSTVLAYLEQDPKLEPFISYFPSVENFGQIMKAKKVAADRSALAEVLEDQYANLGTEIHAKVLQNIELLRQENTFTITTGHQLNIFTGPLYFIYKIVSAINLAKELGEAYPDKKFVPVYWMATEDHDFEEINHTKIQGKKISWDTVAKGATGRLSTESIQDAVREYQKILGLSENSSRLCEIIEEAYLKQRCLADATRCLVNALFDEYGLLIVDADERRLKRQFTTIIQQDIIEQRSFTNISETSKALEQAGYSTQVNAREINFFYLEENLRERIVFEGNRYRVLNTEISFSDEELKAEIEMYPERFSPNVIMRPMYQEVILPNLAYIGGGAEVVYWLQLKKNFDELGVEFPILILRNSALVTTEALTKRAERIGISLPDLFKNTSQLKKEWVLAHSSHTLSLAEEEAKVDAIFEELKTRVTKIDPTLGPSTEAVRSRLHRAIANLEAKLLKAEKRNHNDALNKIESLRAKYFPNEGLQERSENFALFYVKYGETLIAELVKSFHPLAPQFTILEPEI
ncbi:bacillithiol biosynthesis cysteine-adding enzyme BshC [Pedobacter sp. SYSU D00535]|uniref:bacillithiol biosynthesis cysteine-adding enzyme BshC n=1 Tax=Pedobacter sp. SYSU D00535 TaxID=2810308 RepID=UPI001A97CE5B|nr:bacillithiol biosynthesis cysteine-adding enzyme BshC [Pedobacter sp. SYSU D00535]